MNTPIKNAYANKAYRSIIKLTIVNLSYMFMFLIERINMID